MSKNNIFQNSNEEGESEEIKNTFNYVEFAEWMRKEQRRKKKKIQKREREKKNQYLGRTSSDQITPTKQISQVELPRGAFPPKPSLHHGQVKQLGYELYHLLKMFGRNSWIETRTDEQEI